MIRTGVLAFSVIVALHASSSCTGDPPPADDGPVAQAEEATGSLTLSCGHLFFTTGPNACTAGDASTQLPHTSNQPVSCVQSPPGPYGIGVTPVTLTCTAADQTSIACHESVTVTDTSTPLIACPVKQTLVCGGKLGGGVAAAAQARCATPTVPIPPICTPDLSSTFSSDTLVTCTAIGSNARSASCTFEVDVTPGTPVVTPVSGQIVLWPPNHKYRVVNLSQCIQSLSDGCGHSLPLSAAHVDWVSSDEPENSTGDGNTVVDMIIDSDGSVRLLAERKGDEDGRVYTIHYDVDGGGEGTCQVVVPHSQSPSALPVHDDGCDHCVGNCPAGCN